MSVSDTPRPQKPANDDVVIRVSPLGDKGSRVDVRSESRVGGGDAGKNGMRIEAYFARLN